MAKITPEQVIPANDTDPDANSVDGDVAERLRSAVDRVGGATAAARVSQVPLGTLNNYLGGRDMKRGAMVALADATGVSIEWLATGRGSMLPDGIVTLHDQDEADRPAAVQVPAGYAAIPRYNLSASAGSGALVDHPQVVEWMAFAEDFLRTILHRRPQDLLLVRARGDSMEPTVRDGDILTLDIRPDRRLENGSLYVLQLGDALVVKRVEQRTKSIVLHSDNPRYSPETIDRADAEQLQVVGLVILVSAPPR